MKVKRGDGLSARKEIVDRSTSTHPLLCIDEIRSVDCQSGRYCSPLVVLRPYHAITLRRQKTGWIWDSAAASVTVSAAASTSRIDSELYSCVVAGGPLTLPVQEHGHGYGGSWIRGAVQSDWSLTSETEAGGERCWDASMGENPIMLGRRVTTGIAGLSLHPILR